MFTTAVVISLFVHAVLGHPVSPEDSVLVLDAKSINTDNEIAFSYALSDGHDQSQRISIDPDVLLTDGILASGHYTFTAPNGQTFRVTYTAGRNGTVATVRLETPVHTTPATFHIPVQNKFVVKPQSVDGIGCALRASLCG